jgi:DNA-binding MarR family transcriptional regulator
VTQVWLKPSHLHKGVTLLDMLPNERRVLDFLLTNGKQGRWTNFQGGNLAEVIALHLGCHPDSIKRALRSLTKRRWIRIDIDFNDRHIVRLAQPLHEAAQTALDRRLVRSAVGVGRWMELEGDDKLADQILVAITPKPPATYEEAIHPGPQSSKLLIRREATRLVSQQRSRRATKAKKPGDKSSPARGQIVPQQGTNRPLRIVAEQGKR